MHLRGDPVLYKTLEELGISFDYYEQPPVPTVEEASRYWKDIEAAHCKNLFFRNHKGNRQYLGVCNPVRLIREILRGMHAVHIPGRERS